MKCVFEYQKSSSTKHTPSMEGERREESGRGVEGKEGIEGEGGEEDRDHPRVH